MREDWVRYRVSGTSRHVSAGLERHVGVLLIEIEGKKVTVRFRKPMTSLLEAERLVKDFRTSWNGDWYLSEVGLTAHAEWLLDAWDVNSDRGEGVMHARVVVGGSVAEANTRRQRPWRFHEFEEDPLVNGLVRRFESYRRGQEKLSVMSYFCLSAIEQTFGGREQSSRALAVSAKVLSSLGRLVSSVGDLQSARKMPAEPRAFELEEAIWIEDVVRELIARTGRTRLGREVGPPLTLECKNRSGALD
ncbi:MAG TPA: hypothetical protein VNB06_11070 [Thermoanaerobaculia bacterium]|nr:hypothetical protein [Thermoanaerobaculia bacterium]